uniref:Ig-like domain-containing protein n=1 Tax=Esox lucius TaxID=8010 RepID=A0A3P8Z7V5_ESOLU
MCIRIFLGFSVLICIAGGPTRASCPLELNPPSVVVKYGDPVSVNCSTSCTDHVGMGLEATHGGTALQLNATNVTWIVDNLEDWTIQPVCYITTSTNQVKETLPVILYKTPDNMSISLLNHSGPMVEGTEYRLQCDIQNVAPLQNLVVKWYKGNESLLNVTYSNSTKTPVDVSPTLTITPSRDDDGAQYRCEAELDLGPEGPQPPPTVSSEPLDVTVHFMPRNILELRDTEVDVGSSTQLKCNSNGNPPPEYSWTFYRAPNVKVENNDTLIIEDATGANIGYYTCFARNTLGMVSAIARISVRGADPVCPLQLSADRMVIKYEDPVSVLCSTTTSAETLYWTVDSQKINNNTWSVNRLLKWDISPYCNATFPGIGSCRKPLHITVYKTPDNMSISLLNHSGPMVEGTEYRLQCDIQNVAPLQNLVVKWYKGNEFLLNVTYSNSTKTPVDVSPTLIITPSRDDDGAQYRCEAELVLGPEGPQPPPTVSSKYQIYVEIRPQHQPTPGSRNIVQPTAKPKGHNDLLELNPPSVVVKYGDPVSVNCSTSCTDCEGMGWEVTQGGTAFQLNATIVTWIVDNLEDWTIKPMCYITTSTNQVTKTLPVILYKTPDNMSISLLDHSGPMVEGTEYHLQCDIQNVAPVQNLTVKWYKGNESLLNVPCSNSTKTPVDLSPTLTITPSNDDDGAQYRCEAELDLGPEGPQPPPTVSSEPLNFTVHYKPHINASQLPKRIPVFRGYPEELVCEAKGNPKPRIQWFYHQVKLGRDPGGNLTVYEAGLYNCTATNNVGTSFVVVEVILKEDYLPLIAGFVAIMVVVISVIFIFIYSIYYKNTKMGRYSLKDAKLSSTPNGNVAQNGGRNIPLPMTRLSQPNIIF